MLYSNWISHLDLLGNLNFSWISAENYNVSHNLAKKICDKIRLIRISAILLVQPDLIFKKSVRKSTLTYSGCRTLVLCVQILPLEAGLFFVVELHWLVNGYSTLSNLASNTDAGRCYHFFRQKLTSMVSQPDCRAISS